MPAYFRNLSRNQYAHLSLEIAAAKRSLYFWWWKFLRLSEDYWWLCQQNGTSQDKSFSEIYDYFDDVFVGSFDEWWQFYGTRIFGNTLSPNEVQWMTPKLLELYGKEKWVGAVFIPMFRTKKDLVRQFSKLLNDHYPVSPFTEREDGEREFLVNSRGIRRAPIENAHRAYCLQKAINFYRGKNLISQSDKYNQFWIGKHLKLTPQRNLKHGRSTTDIAADRLTMRVKVNRYISRAQSIITNVEYGAFPQVKKIDVPKRWSSKQLKEKMQAIQDGAWKSPEVFCDEVMQKFPFDISI